MTRLVITGGTLLDQHGERAGDLAIEDGHIVAVRDGAGARLIGDTVLDASECIVAPGFVDLHVHLREPGKEEAETIETGSRAAALGGFTAVVAMPNTDPAQDCVAVVDFVRAQGRKAGCARCCRRAASPSAVPASNSPPTASWRRPACTCSPTTATAYKTRS